MQEEVMNIVIVGHVDHGKSTIIGRLLTDTGSLPKGKLAQVKANCERNSKPFEYAFLLDALKDEQAQGITIDIARCFFKTKKRRYIILDAPGHIEFLKNMITGAAHAEAALLVIDAKEGIQENSKRHAYMLSMLGIKQLVVLVNKMDLVDYDQNVFNKIVTDCTLFLTHIDLKPKIFIPVSGMHGDAIAALTANINWFHGPTVLHVIDDFVKAKQLTEAALRMPVQDVYKFTKDNDDRRIIAGMIESGRIEVGDNLVFYPSGKTSAVKSIESFNTELQTESEAGQSIGITLTEQIYIKRGELVAKHSEMQPMVASSIQVSIFWLGKRPLQSNNDYYLKIGTTKVTANLAKVIRVMNAVTLEDKRSGQVLRHEVAECVFNLHAPIAFDLAKDNPLTSRFVVVDNYDLAGGGIIQHALDDDKSLVRKQIRQRNAHWITSDISREERSEKYGQYPELIIISGEKDSGRKVLAKELERILFEQGKKVYYLGIGNVVYGVDADILATKNGSRKEHLRRFAEVVNILLDSGDIVIVTALELSQADVDVIKEVTYCDRIITAWLGKQKTDFQSNLVLDRSENSAKYATKILDELNG